MRAVFDKTELLVLLQDFYELTGLRTVVFDEWGMDILSYPHQLPPSASWFAPLLAGAGLPAVRSAGMSLSVGCIEVMVLYWFYHIDKWPSRIVMNVQFTGFLFEISVAVCILTTN